MLNINHARCNIILLFGIIVSRYFQSTSTTSDCGSETKGVIESFFGLILDHLLHKDCKLWNSHFNVYMSVVDSQIFINGRRLTKGKKKVLV